MMQHGERAHRSRVLNRTLIADADLIVTMESRHVREVVARHDAAWDYTFTLLELVGSGRRLAELVTLA